MAKSSQTLGKEAAAKKTLSASKPSSQKKTTTPKAAKTPAAKKKAQSPTAKKPTKKVAASSAPAQRAPRTAATSKAAATPRRKANTAPQTFYYERRQIAALTFVYAVAACLLYQLTNKILTTGLALNYALCLWQIIVMSLTLAALASVVFVLIFPQPLAITDDEGIKIDHNPKLLWQDIDEASERLSSSVLCRPFIALIIKDESKYKLTFMQRLCRHNIFTPFSIPLYAMAPADAAKITALIKKKVKNYIPLTVSSSK